MDRLTKYVVPVSLIVWGETPEDALEYVHAAIDASDLLDQDGIVGIDDSIDIEDIEPQEE